MVYDRWRDFPGMPPAFQCDINRPKSILSGTRTRCTGPVENGVVQSSAQSHWRWLHWEDSDRTPSVTKDWAILLFADDDREKGKAQRWFALDSLSTSVNLCVDDVSSGSCDRSLSRGHRCPIKSIGAHSNAGGQCWTKRPEMKRSLPTSLLSRSLVTTQSPSLLAGWSARTRPAPVLLSQLRWPQLLVAVPTTQVFFYYYKKKSPSNGRHLKASSIAGWRIAQVHCTPSTLNHRLNTK